jgi:Glycosyltransferase family 25 (LPS biosynthesis protein)
MNSISRVDLQLFIVGEMGSLRSSSLAAYLGSTRLPVTFIPPQYVDGSKRGSMVRFYERMLYLNPLTDGEVGCSVAHWLAQDSARVSDCEWGVFLEDDADLPRNFEEILKSLVSDVSGQVQEPVALQLFHKSYEASILESGNSSLARERAHRLRGTVAYCLSRSAIQSSSLAVFRGDVFCKADFPLWSSTCVWYQATPAVVGEASNVESLVGARVEAQKAISPAWQLIRILMRMTSIPLAYFLTRRQIALARLMSWTFGPFVDRANEITLLTSWRQLRREKQS